MTSRHWQQHYLWENTVFLFGLRFVSTAILIACHYFWIEYKRCKRKLQNAENNVSRPKTILNIRESSQ